MLTSSFSYVVGLQTEGLFRVSGSVTHLQVLKKLYDGMQREVKERGGRKEREGREAKRRKEKREGRVLGKVKPLRQDVIFLTPYNVHYATMRNWVTKNDESARDCVHHIIITPFFMASVNS